MMIQKATNFIANEEQLRLSAYPDAKYGWQVPTIGWGTTVYPDGTKVKRGDKITREQALQFLHDHIDNKIVPALRKIPTWAKMNESQQAALISFAYNLGTHFHSAHNFESITILCDTPSYWDDSVYVHTQFEKYCNPRDPEITNGLKARRKREASLFLGED